MTTVEGSLDAVFGALADPTRRAILSLLVDGTPTVGEVATHFDISRPAITQHLNVLENAGLIERRVQAQWRTCHLRAERLDLVASWIARHRADWNERFDLLDSRIADLKRKEKKNA